MREETNIIHLFLFPSQRPDLILMKQSRLQLSGGAGGKIIRNHGLADGVGDLRKGTGDVDVFCKPKCFKM